MASEPVQNLVQSLMAGRITRRDFVLRLSALGLSMTAIRALLAACAPGGGTSPTSSQPRDADPDSLKATAKGYKGAFAAHEYPTAEQPAIGSLQPACAQG